MRWAEHTRKLARRIWPFRVRAREVRAAGATLTIQHLRDGFTEFSVKSDRDFTAVAEGVRELLSKVNKVKLQTALLDAVLQDRDEQRTLSRAYGVYKFSVDLVHASMGVALADHEQLERVEGKLLEACQARQDLHQFSVLFRMLTVETRMEAARLDVEARGVFETVAHAIDAMGASIRDTASEALGRIETVVSETRAERTELQQHQLALHSEAQRSVQRIRTELDALKAALAPCASKSETISSRIEETKAAVNRAIVGLQAQDIVRQQLEHVSEGFADIDRLADEPGARVQACRVQAGQLRAARERIDISSGQLSGVLNSIVECGRVLGAEFKEMEQAAGNALRDCKLATLFREETEKLAEIADQSERSNRRIAELVLRVDEVIQNFSRQVSEQQFAVKIVALNAQIAAARLALAGGLNRLAQETSDVSDQVGRMTATMTERLVEAVRMLRSIKDEADRFQEVIVRDKHGLEEKSAEVNQMLGVFLNRIQNDASSVSAEFEKLNEKVAETASAFDLRSAIEGCFAPALAHCDEILGSEDAEAASGQHYAVEGRHYTMQSEVLVHRQALAGTEVASAPPPAANPEKDIELF